jgi:hypothetical protein
LFFKPLFLKPFAFAFHPCYALPMTPATQSWLQLLTAIAALGGFFAWQTHYIDKRIDDLRKEFTGLLTSEIGGLRNGVKSEIVGLRDQVKSEIVGLRDQVKSEVAGLRELMNERFKRVDQQFKHVDERLDRLEHPVMRP